MGRARECLRTHVFAGSLHVPRDSDQCALRSSSGQLVSYQRGRSSRTNIRVPWIPILSHYTHCSSTMDANENHVAHETRRNPLSLSAKARFGLRKIFQPRKEHADLA